MRLTSPMPPVPVPPRAGPGPPTPCTLIPLRRQMPDMADRLQDRGLSPGPPVPDATYRLDYKDFFSLHTDPKRRYTA
jgi:hypothetical protein